MSARLSRDIRLFDRLAVEAKGPRYRYFVVAAGAARPDSRATPYETANEAWSALAARERATGVSDALDVIRLWCDAHDRPLAATEKEAREAGERMLAARRYTPGTWTGD